MKTPGLAIPTPKKAIDDEFEDGEDFDETAFLPNNLTPPAQEKENVRYYTPSEVQEMTEKAVKKAQGEWNVKAKVQLEAGYQTKLEELQKEAEESLLEHSRHWEQDHKQEISRIKAECMKQQKNEKEKFDLYVSKMNCKHQDAILALEQKLKNVEKTSQNELLQLREEQDEYYESKMEQLNAEFTRERNDLIGKLEQADMQVKNQNVQIQELSQKNVLLDTQQNEVKQMDADYKSKLQSELQTIKTDLRRKKNQELESLRNEFAEKIEHERQVAVRDKEYTEMQLLEKIAKMELMEKQREEDHERELNELRGSFVGQLQFAQQEIEDHVAAKKDLSLKETKLLEELSEVKRKAELKTREMEEHHHLELKQLEDDLKMNFEAEVEEIDRKLKESLESQATMTSNELQLHEKIAEIENMAKQRAEGYERELQEVRGSLMGQLQLAQQEIEDHITGKKDLSRKEAKLLEELSKTKTNSDLRIGEMDEKYNQELQQLDARYKKKLEAEVGEIESKLNESLARQEAMKTRETELAKLLSQLEKASEKDRENYSLRVEEVRKQHTSEIDDMLSQLDLLEAEHKDRTQTLEQAVNHKDTVISALGTQLAEANQVINELKLLQNDQESRVARLSEDLELSQKELKAKELTYETQLKEMKQIRNAACEKVRNETVAAAEEQFNKANEHYLTLKQRYDTAVARAAVSEREIKSSKRLLEHAKTAHASREAELTAELAQYKAGKFLNH